MRSRRGLLALGLLLTACELERVAIPLTEAQLAMHAVLSATSSTQVVLLERTRTGTVASYDLVDPVVSSALAESGAQVRLTTPDGQTLTAVEDNTVPANRGRGAGIYRFNLPGSALVRGAAYRLAITTASGQRLSAETVVPGGASADVVQQRTFDRARDTVLVQWPASPGARSYFVRVETPFGPRWFFTDSTRIRLTGELRNLQAQGLPRVFIPGFPQAVTVSAVDSNYYDWFRTHNERLSAEGLIDRVSGGIGVFGSIVRVQFQEWQVVTPQVEPAAGFFRVVGTQLELSTTPYLNMELYIESRAARSDQSDAISGRYMRRPYLGMIGCVTCGLLGSVKDGRVQLSLLTAWSARDTAEVFTGEIRGDTIVGSYRGFGVIRFVKQKS